MNPISGPCVVCGSPIINWFVSDYGTSLQCEKCNSILQYEWMLQLRKKLDRLIELEKQEEDKLKEAFAEYNRQQAKLRKK